MTATVPRRYRAVTADFAAAAAGCRSILAVDIAGLGDLVHALPALWSIRCTWPQAQLHCLANANWSALLSLTPWIDRVWPYRERAKSVRWSDLAQARELRRQHIDLSINLMGSNRSCIAAWLSGARLRLGRRPLEDHRAAWRLLNTHVMEYPYRSQPRYLQKWHCLAQAGIATPAPHFEIRPEAATAPQAITPGLPYLHVSPCTSAPQKELAPEQMAALLEALRGRLPQHRLVLSCAPQPRERAVVADLVRRLSMPPWQVFDGTLDAAQLFAVIRGAALHLGGDTGSLHLAWLAQTPSVSWFGWPAGITEWAPQGPQHRALGAPRPPVDHVRGVPTEALVAATLEVITR